MHAKIPQWQLLGKKRNIVSTSQTILFAGYVFGIFVMCFPTDKVTLSLSYIVEHHNTLYFD